MYYTVNGLALWCSTQGSGPPLLLLHGNGEDHTIFDRLAAALAHHFTLVLPDSRCHGKSTRLSRLTYDDLAADTLALIRQLGLVRPFVCGFSDGGITALTLAAAHPGLFRAMAVCGANTCPGGLKATARAGIALHAAATRSMLDRMMQTGPRIRLAQLRQIDVPTLVLAGSRDVVRPVDTRRIAANIPGAQLRILPGETHGSYVVHSTALAPILTDFFNV